MADVYWITGLSGAGKTTLGRCLYEKLKKGKPNVVFLDGDEVRKAIGSDLGYTKEDRYSCAMRYAGLCRLLAEQDMDVICCTISMFDEVRKWNRENINGYIEIYVKVPTEVLKERNQRNLYHKADLGKEKNVVGINLELELPKAPDVLIENDGSRSILAVFQELMEELENRFKNQ